MSSEWPPTPGAWPVDPAPVPDGSTAADAPQVEGQPSVAPPFESPVPPTSPGPDYEAAGPPPQYPPAQYGPGQQPPADYPPARYGPGQYPPADYPPAQYGPGQYPPADYPPAQYPPGAPDASNPQTPEPEPRFVPGHYGPDGEWVPPQFPPSLYATTPWPGGPAGSSPDAAGARSKLSLARVVAAGLSGVALVLVVIWFNTTFLQPPAQSSTTRPSATASAPSAKPAGSASPKPSPKATMPDDPKVLLKQNPIYALKVPASCPEQGRPSSKAEFRSQVKALVACENVAWKKALAGTPVEFKKPKVTFYGTRTESACGTLGSTFPAAYCSVERTLYFSTASYQQGRYYRLAVAQFVMHEYAHHVQQLAEIFPSTDSMNESRVVSTRRVELQAHCMAHYQLTHSGLGFDSLDRGDAEFQFGYAADPKGHGSATAERYWGRRGLDATTIGACNTWTVKAGKVK